MSIINGKFNPEELIKIYGIEPFMGDIKDLSIYNNAPYFNIQKFYNDGILVGYAVIFLGYNSLTSSDASLEDVVYWHGTPEELEDFLKQVYDSKDYSLPVETIYFDPDKFAETISITLNKIGFKETSRAR